MTDQTPQIAVAGERMERSIAEFQRSCIVHIAEEQGRANPDNALIAVLCDAVRCSRELAAHAADAARLQQQEQEIVGMRRWMWLNHGCKASMLYGDDGEMQCSNVAAHPGNRLLDFKRDDLPSLVVAVANGAERKAEADNAALRAQVATLTRERDEAKQDRWKVCRCRDARPPQYRRRTVSGL